jgi:hypothetical protein
MWKGTPLHELWLKGANGSLIEISARLTGVEFARKRADEQPEFLTTEGVAAAPSAGCPPEARLLSAQHDCSDAARDRQK